MPRARRFGDSGSFAHRQFAPMRRAAAAAALTAVLLAAARAAGDGFEVTLGEDVHDISAASVDVSRPQAAAVERSAGDGDADSKYFLGRLALYGKGGVERDPAKAVGAFRGAAERGHLEAATATGMMLRHGLGVARDDRAALQWFAAAAQKGHAHGMFMYGLVLAEGRGALAPDATAAREWL